MAHLSIFHPHKFPSHSGYLLMEDVSSIKTSLVVDAGFVFVESKFGAFASRWKADVHFFSMKFLAKRFGWWSQMRHVHWLDSGHLNERYIRVFFCHRFVSDSSE